MKSREWSRLVASVLAPHWDNYLHYNGFDRTRQSSHDIRRGIDAVRDTLADISPSGDEHFVYRRAIQHLRESKIQFINHHHDPHRWGLCVFNDVIGEFEYLSRRFPHATHVSYVHHPRPQRPYR